MQLPEHDFYNIPRLLNRWRSKGWRCSEDDVFSYIKSQKLIPAFDFDDIKCVYEVYDAGTDSLVIIEPTSKIGTDLCYDNINKVEVYPHIISGRFEIDVLSLYSWAHTKFSKTWTGNLKDMHFPKPRYINQEIKWYYFRPIVDFPVGIDDFMFLPNEIERFEKEGCKANTSNNFTKDVQINEISQSTVTEITPKANKPTGRPPNRAGKRGHLRTMIVNGLLDFYKDKKRWPETGRAFHDFLSFIHQLSKSELKPDYMKSVEIVHKVGEAKKTCITFKVKNRSRSYTREYVEDRYYCYQGEIIPK
jgi:hypothetical protein